MIPILERLLSKVTFPVDIEKCWIWNGARNPSGYGLISAGRRGGATLRVHRVTYEYTHGAIPLGLTLDHTCNTPACVNPLHLEAVTNKVNSQRRVSNKLSYSKVDTIKQSTRSTTELAKQFGVDYTTILYIRSGKRWS